MWEPPLVTDGVVAVHDSDAIHALDGATGRMRWSTEFAKVIGAGNGTVLARVYDRASASGYVMTAFDAATGTPRWSYPVPDSDDVFDVLPEFDGGLVHVGMDRSLLTFDVATGTLQRQLPVEGTVKELGIAGGLLYYRPDTGGVGETFVAIDAITSARRWRRTTEFGMVFPSTADGGALFMDAGSIEAWDAATGEPRWAVEEFASGLKWNLDTSLIAAAGGICYIGGAELVYGPDGAPVNGPDGTGLTAYSLYAFSADSGRLRWRLPIDPGPGLGAPLVAVPGTVFLGGKTAMVHAVSEV
jgi:outer membrane protein assembly factor BamB